MIVDRKSAKLNLQRMRDMVVEYIGGLPFSGDLLDEMTQYRSERLFWTYLLRTRIRVGYT